MWDPLNDMSYAYDSALKQASNAPPNGDPFTPLMRAYQNDNVQVRVLVGAHVFAHQFNLGARPGFPSRRGRTPAIAALRRWDSPNTLRCSFSVPSSSAPNNGRKCPDGMSQGKLRRLPVQSELGRAWHRQRYVGTFPLLRPDESRELN